MHKNRYQANYDDIFQNKFLGSISSLKFKGNILITGARGMLGNALACAINELLSNQSSNGVKLILCSRDWKPAELIYWKNYEYVENVTNFNLLSSYKSVDLVIHTASPSNMTKITTIDDLRIPNIELLKDIFKLNPKKILYVSSGEVYGGGTTFENQHSNKFSFAVTRDWYPLIKIETEKILHDFGKINKVHTIAVRLFHTYGPGMKFNDGRSFADILWGGGIEKQIVLKSNGSQTRSFLYLSDAVSGILKTLCHPQSGQFTLNIGSEVPITILKFAELVSTLTGASIYRKMDDKYIHSPNEYIVPKLDTIKDFNWHPVVDITSGISITLRWIESYKMKL